MKRASDNAETSGRQQETSIQNYDSICNHSKSSSESDICRASRSETHKGGYILSPLSPSPTEIVYDPLYHLGQGEPTNQLNVDGICHGGNLEQQGEQGEQASHVARSNLYSNAPLTQQETVRSIYQGLGPQQVPPPISRPCFHPNAYDYLTHPNPQWYDPRSQPFDGKHGHHHPKQPRYTTIPYVYPTGDYEHCRRRWLQDYQNSSEGPHIKEPIKEPNQNDVLSGRGGKINSNPGNIHFRTMVKEYKDRYLETRKKEKLAVAKVVVNLIRDLDPPGRFLEKPKNSEYWVDIGTKRAIEKASQLLREGSPVIRKRKHYDKAVEVDRDSTSNDGQRLITSVSKKDEHIVGAMKLVDSQAKNAQNNNNIAQHPNNEDSAEENTEEQVLIPNKIAEV